MTRLRAVTPAFHSLGETADRHFGVQARRSIMEYAQALRSRYFGASRADKGKMLDEFTQVTGLHRKAAIRLLHRLGQPNIVGDTNMVYGKVVKKYIEGGEHLVDLEVWNENQSGLATALGKATVTLPSKG